MLRPTATLRWKRVAVALALSCWLWSADVRADDEPRPATESSLGDTSAPSDSMVDIVRSFGQQSRQSRSTLLQWSDGGDSSGGANLDEPLVTDRPDFTAASSTVGQGVTQIEMGYTFTHDNNGTTSTDSHSYPETLLRFGVLADWLELRVAWNYGQQSSVLDDLVGSEDLYLACDFGLTPQDGILPEMTLIAQMTVPTGSDDLTGDRVLPGLDWVYGWEVGDFLSTAGSTQFNSAIDDETDGLYTEWAQSWTIGYTLTEKLGAYTECYALFPHNAATMKPEYYFDGGFTYLISDNIQWDIRGGIGLNDAADDYFVGSGLSIRFY